MLSALALQLRHIVETTREHPITPGGERTAPRKMQQARHRAFDGVQLLALSSAFDTRNRSEKPLRIGVQRIFEKLENGGRLHHLASIHNMNVVAHLRHHPKIVGNENDGGVDTALQIKHELEYLGLNGHIQRRGGLIRNEEFWFADEGHGDHHSLAQPSRKLMRITAAAGGGLRDPHQIKHVDYRIPALPGIHGGMKLQHLPHLLQHCMYGVEGCHGLLKDHGEFLSPEGAHLPGGFTGKIGTLKKDLSLHDTPRRGDKPHDREGCHALAAAGFSHQPCHLSPGDIKGDPVHRRNHSPTCIEMGFEITYFKCMVRHCFSPFP
jgi:hypothetical protein